ncbi:hypothetical protein CP533_0272 [Ophiocordyceps camponoti-saundersi (nom. inval.)]|nr:hypothetical protein CP533_0272 [Ophiocordyceps camponoti-saundersi (nom. inval.)]
MLTSWRPILRKASRHTVLVSASFSVSASGHRGHHVIDADCTAPPTSKLSGLNYGRRRAIDTPVTDGLGPNHRSLRDCNVIQQMPGGELSTRVTKSQAHTLFKARDFFQGKGCSYLYSAENLRQHPINEHIPEILVMGASNVGKSTFINALLCRRDACRVSRLPGKTTLMHAFGVGPQPSIPPSLIRKGQAPPRYSLRVIDTPGYGHMSRESWGQSILKYMEKRTAFRGALLLLSSDKQQPTADDQWMLEMLAEREVKVVVALTKADKYRHSWPSRCADMAKAVSVMLRSRDVPVFVISAAIAAPGNIGNTGGMGGVRVAVLETAGLQLRRDGFELMRDKGSYGGRVVPFDEIQLACP